MADCQELLEQLKHFQSVYRRSGFEPFSVGPLYDLFPNRGHPATPCELSWANTWANNGKAGVYALFDEDLQLLLYIGKASLKSNVGARLGSYFGYGLNRECKVKHSGWSKSPRYVLTVGVPDTMKWEAPALEVSDS